MTDQVQHLIKYQPGIAGKKTRLSHPNLHMYPTVRTYPPSQSSLDSHDSSITLELTQSTTPCPQGGSYSPACSQRSRYSQPNLPNLLVSYEQQQLMMHHQRKSSAASSPDPRRTRFSQPTLNSSFSGSGRLSYSSLRASGANSVSEEERYSRTTVQHRHSSIGMYNYYNNPRYSQPDIRPPYSPRGSDAFAKRERLSQPTLVTGDHYGTRAATAAHQHQQQRHSQPCLLNDRETFLYSPLKHKRFNMQRDRLSQLDFGPCNKYRAKQAAKSSGSGGTSASASGQSNRDRFSVPALETQNDLRAFAGSPKQRFSLDSQLNPDRAKLLPIASSPIAELQAKLDAIAGEGLAALSSAAAAASAVRRHPAEGLESALIASTTPIFPFAEQQQFLSPFVKANRAGGQNYKYKFSKQKNSPIKVPLMQQQQQQSTEMQQQQRSPPPPPGRVSPRERMSVPEIRNSSLKRLLDPPVKQRHSITGNLRQSITGHLPTLFAQATSKGFELAGKRSASLKKDRSIEHHQATLERMHSRCELEETVDSTTCLQRHYSYVYDTAEEQPSSAAAATSMLNKLLNAKPRRMFLESNFDENEQVITRVIETEVPYKLSSPKYMKKTHVYSSEKPKWMIKCLDADDEQQKAIVKSCNQRNKQQLEGEMQLSSKEISDKMNAEIASFSSKTRYQDTCVRIKSSNSQETKYEVTTLQATTANNNNNCINDYQRAETVIEAVQQSRDATMDDYNTDTEDSTSI